MNSGLYTAYSGMRAQSDALEVMANNLANANTAGFKEEKVFFSVLNQTMGSSRDAQDMSAAINSKVLTQKGLNQASGSLNYTARDLDVAIAGNGFLVVETPQGIRYTRNGSLQLNAQGVLTNSDGNPILGASGNKITLGSGKKHISENGQISVDDTQIDRLKIVTFDNLSTLEKEGGSLFIARGQNSEKISDAAVKSGYLEQSNVNAIGSVVQMVQIMRHFEAIQKSVNLLMNDINSKAIEKLGR